MDLMVIDVFEVLAGTIAGMMLGAFWYSSLAFGPAWMASLGKTPETLGGQGLPMAGSVLASLMTAVAVSLLSAGLGVDSLGQAATLGLLLGLLVIFPALLSDNLFCGWGGRLLLIQAGYRIATVVLMAVVIYLVGALN